MPQRPSCSSKRDGVGFHSCESHNIFLQDHKVTNQTSSDLHPRFIELKSSKTLLNACDLAKSSIALEHLDTLFSSSLITEFVSEILQTNVHPSVDKYGMYYGNIYNESDGLSWHLDRSQFSISLTLQPSLGGGEFVLASFVIVLNYGYLPRPLTTPSQRMCRLA